MGVSRTFCIATGHDHRRRRNRNTNSRKFSILFFKVRKLDVTAILHFQAKNINATIESMILGKVLHLDMSKFKITFRFSDHRFYHYLANLQVLMNLYVYITIQ